MLPAALSLLALFCTSEYKWRAWGAVWMIAVSQGQVQFPEFAVSLRRKGPSRQAESLLVSHCCCSFPFRSSTFCFVCWSSHVLTWGSLSDDEMVLRCIYLAKQFPLLFCRLLHSHTASAKSAAQPWVLIHRVHTTWHWLAMMDECTVSLLWAVVQVTVEEITIVIGFAYLPHLLLDSGFGILHSTCKSFVLLLCFYLYTQKNI